MTIQTRESSVIHTGDGLNTEFSVPYPFLDDTHLHVYAGAGELGGVDRLLELGVDYGVCGQAASGGAGFTGGTVVMARAPVCGMKIAILREVPFTQEAEYPEGGRFPARSHEMALDKVTMEIQQLAALFSRTPYGQPTSGASGAAIIAQMLEWHERTGDSAAAAATGADRAEKAAGEAKESAARAAADADRAAALVDPASLASSVFNVRKAFVAETAVASGGTLTLPGYYYPTRDVLYLACGGVVCTPKVAGTEASGRYQYAEVGDDPDTASNRIVVYFDVAVGDVLDMWVVSPAAGCNSEMENRYEFPPSPPVSRRHEVLAADLAAGTAYAVPLYIAGAARLQVFIDGVLCASGDSRATAFYRESGDAGANATEIVFFETLSAGTHITAIAAA